MWFLLSLVVERHLWALSVRTTVQAYSKCFFTQWICPKRKSHETKTRATTTTKSRIPFYIAWVQMTNYLCSIKSLVRNSSTQSQVQCTHIHSWPILPLNTPILCPPHISVPSSYSFFSLFHCVIIVNTKLNDQLGTRLSKYLAWV